MGAGAGAGGAQEPGLVVPDRLSLLSEARVKAEAINQRPRRMIKMPGLLISNQKGSVLLPRQRPDTVPGISPATFTK